MAQVKIPGTTQTVPVAKLSVGQTALKHQISALRGSSKLAAEIVGGLAVAFAPEDDSSEEFENLLEVTTWLYVNGYNGSKLARFYAAITKTNKVTPESMAVFVVQCRVRINDIQRKEAVESIINGVTTSLQQFVKDPQATLNDKSLMLGMFNIFYADMIKHKIFRENRDDSIKRAVFACHIILHEERHCKLLNGIILNNGLGKSPEYENLKTRKKEEVRIVLAVLSSLEIADMCDKLDTDLVK